MTKIPTGMKFFRIPIGSDRNPLFLVKPYQAKWKEDEYRPILESIGLFSLHSPKIPSKGLFLLISLQSLVRMSAPAGMRENEEL